MEKLVFIIDDEKSIARLLTHWLKDKWKYNVEVFENGEEALKKFSSNPDLILLDIMLPDIDGIEILKRIKKTDDKY